MKNSIILHFFALILLACTTHGTAQQDSISGGTYKASSETVNIAFGTQDKQNVSSAISTATGDELVNGAIANFGNALFGRFPGLFVQQGSGEPSSDFPSIRMRGATQSPLIMIDGFERDMSFIAPEEIESVSVLKDAAAVALYGMNGANGAIVITTKRGKIQKNEIRVTIQSGLQTPERMMEVLGASQYMNYYNQAAVNDGLPEKYTSSEISSAGSGPRYPDVDWQDLILKNATNISRANVGFLGGTDFARYYVNFGLLYKDGIYKPVNPDFNANNSLARINVRSNIDVNITKKTVFSIDLAGSINRNVYPADNSQRIWNALMTLPPNAMNPVNPDNSYGGTSLLLNNPLAMLEKSGRNTGLDQYLNATFRIEQNLDAIAKGLSANLAYVIDNGASNAVGNWRFFEVKEIAPGSGEEYTYYRYRENAQYNQWSNSSSTRNITFAGDLTYDIPEIAGNKVDVYLRFQRDRQYLANSDLFPYLTNNIGSRIQYSKDNKYLVELAASYFGSDQYKQGNQYGFFPSVSLGWVFSNEDFASNNLITYGKLKGSYGVAGNNRFVNGRYPFAQYYENGGAFPIGESWDWFNGVRPDMLANPDIKWEISNKFNIGLELELFDMFSFEVDYFDDRRSDVLYIDFQNPAFSGATIPFENIGELHSNGYDLKLGYESSDNEFIWFADIIFSQFNTEIVEMGEAMNVGELENLNRTGNSVTAIYGYESVGQFANEQVIQSSPTQTFGSPRVGDLKYKDQNNDNIIDSRDITVIGDALANTSLGLSFGFQWRNFDANTFFQGQLNHDINLAGNPLAQPFIHGNAVNEIVTEEGFPTLTLSNLNNYQSSSYWIRNGNFLKMRNLEVGYGLPANVIGPNKKDQVRLYLRGINVFTLSSWKYTDPEFTGIGYPPMKSLLVGLNLNF